MPVLCLCPYLDGKVVLWCLMALGSELHFRQHVYFWLLPAINLFAVLHADIAKLQQPDGSFAGDEWGEVDTRCVCNLPALNTGSCLSSPL